MPPRYPRLCPVLEVARPSDSPGRDPGYRPDSSPWEFLFGDGEWHQVRVVAWWTDRHMRQVVQVEFHADGSTYEETYLFDGEKAREGCAE